MSVQMLVNHLNALPDVVISSILLGTTGSVTLKMLVNDRHSYQSCSITWNPDSYSLKCLLMAG